MGNAMGHGARRANGWNGRKQMHGPMEQNHASQQWQMDGNRHKLQVSCSHFYSFPLFSSYSQSPRCVAVVVVVVVVVARRPAAPPSPRHGGRMRRRFGGMSSNLRNGQAWGEGQDVRCGASAYSLPLSPLLSPISPLASRPLSRGDFHRPKRCRHSSLIKRKGCRPWATN